MKKHKGKILLVLVVLLGIGAWFGYDFYKKMYCLVYKNWFLVSAGAKCLGRSCNGTAHFKSSAF